MKTFLFLLLALVLFGATLAGTACGDKEIEEARLPVLGVGDEWTYNMTSEGQPYTWIEKVFGHGKRAGTECYLVQVSIDPPYKGVANSAELWVEEETLRTQWILIEGPSQYVMRMDISWDRPPLFPLTVGKQISGTETDYIVVESNGEVQNSETETHLYTYKVESIENITVAAGTFNCFKIVKYENGSPVNTTWYSDKVKSGDGVKSVNHETGEILELVSYSVK